MSTASPFKWRHYLPDIILLNVRCRYPLSYQSLEKLIVEQEVDVDHSTIALLTVKITALNFIPVPILGWRGGNPGDGGSTPSPIGAIS